MLMEASAEHNHSCRNLASPQRDGVRKRAHSATVMTASLKITNQHYNPVPLAYNNLPLRETVKGATGVDITRGVAAAMLSTLEKDSDVHQLAEFAQLPEVFEHLRRTDPRVSFRGFVFSSSVLLIQFV